MSKRALIASTIILAFVAPASAETVFRGTLQITAANTSCTIGPSAGDIDHGLFHPRAVPGNLNFSALNRISNFTAQSWALDSGNFNSVFKQVTNNGIGWSDFTPDQPSFVRVTSQVPATLATNTPSVTLVGQVKNPFGETGQENCIASFRYLAVREL